MNQGEKQIEPSDNQKEKQQQQNKNKQEQKQKQQNPFKPKWRDELMIVRMQTGKDGMNFEEMARDAEGNENYSKVIQNILIKN